MLPPAPPKLSHRDFDPATVQIDEDVEMRSDEAEGKAELSSVEINILIYLYLLESNFPHTAFTLLSESSLPSTSLFQHFHPPYPSSSSSQNNRPHGVSPRTASPGTAPFGRTDGRIERGELVRKLWKGLRWEEIERHVAPNGEPYKPTCPVPFHLLIPHVCPPSYPSSASNPPHLPSPSLRVSPPLAKRSEAFPPPENSTAGASHAPQASDRNAPAKGKLKTRRQSTESSSRNPSPARSVSPVKEKKKRARVSDGNGMELDEEPRRRGSGKEGSAKLDVSDMDRRSRSPGNGKTVKKMPRSDISVAEEDVRSWSEHRDFVSCLAWNPKNRDVLATGSNDGTARLWDLPKGSDGHALSLGKKPTSINHKSIDSSKKGVTAISWHPDGTVLATASQDGVARLFTPSGQLQGIMSYGRGSIHALKFSPSGSAILTAKWDFTVCLWIVDNTYQQTMARCFDSHTKEVNDVDWLDDDVFASAGNDHTIFVYRANDKRPRFTFKGHTDDVTRIKWSPPQPGIAPHQRLLASVSDDGNVMVWRLPTYPDDRGTHSRSLSPIKAAKESSEDDYFQSAGAVLGIEYCVNRLSVVTGSENRRMDTVEWSSACREGHMILAAGGQDSTVKVFDAISGETLHTLSGLETGTGSIAFSPTGRALAGGGWNGQLVVWDVSTGVKMREYEIDEDLSRQTARERPMMMAMRWRDDGEQLAVGLHNKMVMTLWVGDRTGD